MIKKSRTLLKKVKELSPKLTFLLLAVLLFSGSAIAQTVGPFIRFEAEQGTLSGNATTASDSLASAGNYLQFTSGSSQTGVLWSEDFATLSDLDSMVAQGGDALGINNNPESLSNGHHALTFHADHDQACGAPTTFRNITANNAWPNHVYWCPNAGGHFMTAMNSTSYVAFGFSPRGNNNRAMIFPPTANKMCIDVNITGMGNRRWWDMLVLSEATYLRNSFPTNVSGQPGGAVTNEPTLIYFDPNHAMSGLTVGLDADFHFVDHEGSRHVASRGAWVYDNHGVVNRGITDKASRFKTCVKDNGNGTVTHTQARPDGSTQTTVMTNSSFPSGNRVFIVLDKTYNADKAENPSAVTDGYTWHWDTFQILAE